MSLHRRVAGTASRWAVVPGVRLGMGIEALEGLNGRPFTLTGADPNAGAFTVLSWDGGRLIRDRRLVHDGDRFYEARQGARSPFREQGALGGRRSPPRRGSCRASGNTAGPGRGFQTARREGSSREAADDPAL